MMSNNIFDSDSYQTTNLNVTHVEDKLMFK